MVIAIIGGAAGFFAAIRAREVNPAAKVLIFEKSHHVLSKLAVTGGGRCNLTNSFASVTNLTQVYPRGEKLLKRLFRVFNHEDTFHWFTEHGVPLVIQEDDCVFPLSQSAMSVVNCLMNEASRLGVVTLIDHCLQAIQKRPDGRLLLSFTGQTKMVEVDRVIIATGGHAKLTAFDYLADLGHEIVSPVPSLYTFTVEDKSLRAMMGTVITHAVISIVGERFRSEGALLVTHWGMSGPAVLRLSSYAARWLDECKCRFSIRVNWAGSLNVTEVTNELNTLVTIHRKKEISNVHLEGIPLRLWHHLLQRAFIPLGLRCGELGRKGMNKLAETICNDIYVVSGKSFWREEFVTCGGVSLSSIQMNTLQSKCVKGLYFAGEVTDVDGVTGGFNLQAAWTMGYVSGENAAHEENGAS